MPSRSQDAAARTLLAAEITAAPKRSPGARVSRSTGPLTLTAASRLPAPSTDRRADRGHAGLALLHALDPTGRPELARQHAPGRARRAAGAGRPRARSSAGRGATAATRRSAARRPRGRTAGRSRRSRRAARSAPAGRARRAGTRPPRHGRARPAPARGTKRPAASRRTSPCCSSATARRWAVARGRPVAACSSASPLGRRAPARGARQRPCRAPRRSIRCPSVKNTISGCETRCEKRMTSPTNPAREGLGAPPRAHGARRARPALHRPPPRPRGHQPAGVRRPAPERPHGPPARADDRHRGPQRPDRATSTSRSPIRSRPARSRCCARTRPSSASPTSRWAIPARASSTSSAPSRAARCRA